jgi:(4-(4-[2-(gamma-L-glutamylamino)ethyl]phenoxymethyl)furan-2-yl)methanamine synthase
MRWIGLDIGGANLKLADCTAFARQMPFAMWRQPDHLHEALVRLISDMPEFDAVALTMTGEMADCFETREEGVCRILEQVTRVIPASVIQVYSVDGHWLSVSKAARAPWRVAASNWKALATYTARWTAAERALLVDVGSTTTDIIAIADMKVLSTSTSDRERLVSGELVYTGIERSSVVGLVRDLVVHGQNTPVVNENFATTGDVNLILGYADESESDCDTADSRPKTRMCAAYRLARVVGEDGNTLSSQDIELMAEAVYEAQVDCICRAMSQVAKAFHGSPLDLIVFSGHGDFLIEDAIERNRWNFRRVKLSEKLGTKLSRCAPAHAVAVLAQEAFTEDMSGG